MASTAVRLSLPENLRFALDFQRDAPDAFTKWHAIRGPTFTAKIPGHRLVSTTDPVILRYVLQDKGGLFSKGRFADDLSPFWGTSTVQIADGADWARQRRACVGFFSRSNNHVYERAVEQRLEPMLQSLHDAARSGEAIHIYYAARDVCYHALCDVWFRGVGEPELQRMAELIRAGTDIASRRMLQLLKLPLWWPVGANYRYRRIAAEAYALAERMIGRARSEQCDYLLGSIACSIDADPARALSPIEARNNVFMFLLACYEWPTLGWLLHELGTRKVVRRSAFEELLKLKQPASEARNASLPYLQGCIKETFRLRPPAPLIGRTVIAASEINGVSLKPGQSLVIPVKAVQRDPQRWEDPDMFRPERFLEPRSDLDYLAFGTGPRGCIGQSMAIQVMQNVVSGILAKFDFEVVGSDQPVMHDKLKSYPKGGVPVRISYH